MATIGEEKKCSHGAAGMLSVLLGVLLGVLFGVLLGRWCVYRVLGSLS